MTIDPASSSSLARRSFLRLVATTGLTMGAGSALVSGCTGRAGSDGDNTTTSGSVKMPTYTAFEGSAPDLPGTAEGIEPGYKAFPSQLARSVKDLPGDGSTVTALTALWGTAPPPMSRNTFWQEMNKRLGVTFDANLTTGYSEKFATRVAGGDIPDVVWIGHGVGLSRVGQLLEAKFQDLTPYLSGDAVKEYPNLAALSPVTWPTTVIGGKIWGVPSPGGIFGQMYIGNNQRWDPVGGFQCKSAQEFLDKAKQITVPKEQRWALDAKYSSAINMFSEWFRVPNTWRLNKDGTLTHGLETEEYLEALAFAVKVYQAGVFYPDPTTTASQALFRKGAIAARVNSWAGSKGSLSADRKAAGLENDLMIPFGHDGGAAVKHLWYPTLGFAGIKQTDEKRVRMLLRVLDYLCAPFGTEEWVFLHYGTRDTHYTVDPQGKPELTEKGTLEVSSLIGGIGTMCQSNPFIFDPAYPDVVDQIHGIETKLLPIGIQDPTIGHYSEAETNLMGTVDKAVNDFEAEVVTGRRPISDFKDKLKEWQSRGINEVRREYQESISKRG